MAYAAIVARRWARPLAHAQAAYPVRFEWGPTGADAIADGAACAVVVDVLSFTTTVTVAVERGIAVHPFAWKALIPISLVNILATMVLKVAF